MKKFWDYIIDSLDECSDLSQTTWKGRISFWVIDVFGIGFLLYKFPLDSFTPGQFVTWTDWITIIILYTCAFYGGVFLFYILIGWLRTGYKKLFK